MKVLTPTEKPEIPGSLRASFWCAFYKQRVEGLTCVQRQQARDLETNYRHCLGSGCAQGCQVYARLGAQVPQRPLVIEPEKKGAESVCLGCGEVIHSLTPRKYHRRCDVGPDEDPVKAPKEPTEKVWTVPKKFEREVVVRTELPWHVKAGPKRDVGEVPSAIGTEQPRPTVPAWQASQERMASIVPAKLAPTATPSRRRPPAPAPTPAPVLEVPAVAALPVVLEEMTREIFAGYEPESFPAFKPEDSDTPEDQVIPITEPMVVAEAPGRTLAEVHARFSPPVDIPVTPKPPPPPLQLEPEKPMDMTDPARQACQGCGKTLRSDSKGGYHRDCAPKDEKPAPGQRTCTASCGCDQLARGNQDVCQGHYNQRYRQVSQGRAWEPRLLGEPAPRSPSPSVTKVIADARPKAKANGHAKTLAQPELPSMPAPKDDLGGFDPRTLTAPQLKACVRELERRAAEMFTTMRELGLRVPGAGDPPH